jgi:uncharacterized protein YndB with AHSA1/START domain
MSRFAQSAATMHTLSLAAMEEASRFGVRDADIDHLLLALTIDPDAGGQVLRRAGLRLTAVRTAVADQHAEQLGALGLAPDPAASGRIVFHETSGYDWTDRAIAVLRAGSEQGRRGDSAAVLRALLDEPSGLITAVLQRLGVDPVGIATELDELSSLADTAPRRSTGAGITSERAVFVPAPPTEVWALLSDPARIPEWDPSTAQVTPDADPADGWDARAHTTTSDGRPIRRKEAFVRRRILLASRDEPTAVAWRFLLPDAPRTNPRVVTFALEPVAGGTRLMVSVTWETLHRRGRRVLRAVLRPLHRLALFLQLAQIESGVTRVFR